MNLLQEIPNIRRTGKAFRLQNLGTKILGCFKIKEEVDNAGFQDRPYVGRGRFRYEKDVQTVDG